MKVFDSISASMRDEETYEVVVHFQVGEVNHPSFGRGVQMDLQEWGFCLN
jgi:hypothetical protein